MTLAEAAAQADAFAEAGNERELAKLRAEWDELLESSARGADFRDRAIAYRAIGQFRFRTKKELLRRGLEDDSPAVRGSALLALEKLSRDHPGDVNDVVDARSDPRPIEEHGENGERERPPDIGQRHQGHQRRGEQRMVGREAIIRRVRDERWHVTGGKGPWVRCTLPHRPAPGRS